jgi:hypothetical protein
VLKVNAQEKKQIYLLDLLHEVDFTSNENTIVYASDVLEVINLNKIK